MTQHTPGPWTIQRLETQRNGYDWQTFAIRSPQNVCLTVVGDVDRFESERIPANASLIAHAPAMREALRMAAGRLEFLHGLSHPNMACGHIDNAEWLEPARAILRAVDGDA